VLSFVSLEHKMRAMALGSFPELVMIIDGRRDLEQLSRVWQGSRFELYRFLHGLLKEGALTTSVP
jgi:hypothetical protein